ncbi:HEAT repeat domain-containing protein [Sphingomonas sp. LY160]|uniref:HEAT repeat domain-containing protein n=1 Tax=Sphingomonas sp. LY160 TaxID=3095342 RepID=UPI002ADEDA63|nr:HEAT repeat domain-containing protein [Sphingomonas sp. LY160]MEA1070926.1 HEAT repeat domain-containing protein [Sphingomonas sp. LY160]
MNLLSLWAVSVVLSGVALLIMIGLILGRFASQRRQDDLSQQRKTLLPLLLGDAGDEVIQDASVKRSPILRDLSIELIQLVRGEERQQLIATATRLGVAESIRKVLAKGTTRARVVAAETLADFPDEFTTDALHRALEDRNDGVRLAAALALASSDRAPPAQTLVQLLDLGMREQSMLIVALFQEIARSSPAEIRSLIDDQISPPKVKAAAIEALSASGDYSLVPSIVQLALKADPYGEELPRYLRSLGAFQHPAGAPAIVQWLSAPTWWVRTAAAEAAGRIGLQETQSTLVNLLDDPDWWVRFRAGEALVRLGAEAQQLLAKVAATGSQRASSAARLTLAEQAVPA